MKKIVINGEELAVSAAGERALRVLKDSNYVAKKGAFQEGSGNYRSTCLPRSAAERAELGIDMVHYCLLVLYQRKSILQEKIARFFIEHPRCQLAVMGDQGRVDAILEAIDG
jgi:hypothetical protein